MALNTKQAIRLLSEDESNYIHHNSLGHSTIYDSSGDELVFVKQANAETK